jgi:glutamate synthase (ferredoxin)
VGVFGDVLTSAKNIVAKGRLGPGQMVLANLEDGTFKTNTELSREISSRQPYAEWLKKDTVRLADLNVSPTEPVATLTACQ